MRLLAVFFIKFIRQLGHPRQLLFEIICLPRYVGNMISYIRNRSPQQFKIEFSELRYSTSDSLRPAGQVDIHYFLQDIWAGRHILSLRPDIHYDIGGRLEGLVSHLLSSRQNITYLDWRDPQIKEPNFVFRQADIMRLPFADNSVKSLSCLHVLEHIGLGRYGDPVNPEGYIRAALELSRVLAPGGYLLLSVPIGRERVCFDAHRVFNPTTILSLFSQLHLVEFSYIEPEKLAIIGATQSVSGFAGSDYSCGLFMFRK